MSRAARKDRRDRPSGPRDPGREAGGRSPEPRGEPEPRLDPHRRQRVPLWPLLAAVAVQASFLAAVTVLAVRYPPPPKLVASDAAALPGGEAAFEVRLEQAGPSFTRRPVEDLKVAVYPYRAEAAAGQPAATAAFDSAGFATCRLKAPDAAGTHRYAARLEGPWAQAVPAGEVRFSVEVLPASRPLLVVMVPGAVAEPGSDLPRAGALEALRELARAYSLVYVATRRHDEPDQVRAWLGRLGLEAGPVLTGRASEPASPAGPVALLPLSSWQAAKWAVAAMGAEARALTSLGLNVVHLGGSGAFQPDGRTKFHATDWLDAKKKIQSKA
ncbi:MAG: hypothetical protein HY721_23005 [Planctomycetes bacterium]|nr:hypothetical protein [Planctomycetota bacterium]